MAKYEKWITEEGLLQIGAWARDGLSNAQIADKIGITQSTYYDWLKKHSEISEAIKNSKEVADIRVENALYKRAIGFEYTETRVEIMPDGTKRGLQVTKTVPPDTGAIAFWLKNRKPDSWKDKRVDDVTISTEDGGIMSEIRAKMRSDDP